MIRFLKAGPQAGRIRRHATTALISTAACALALPALAAEPDSKDAFALEEIVVTARRVEERLQDAPVAVTAFSADALEMRSAAQLDDIARFTPGVAIYPGGFGVADSGQAFIRGIGQFDYMITTDPGVGVYLDGVYLARTTGNLLDLADVERIEVLRGPQGTLYGKNALGGAINVVTRRPGDDFRGSVTGTIGSYDRRDAHVKLSGPLEPGVLAASASVLVQRRDGFIKRVLQPGERQGDMDSQAGRLALRWTPSENFSYDVAGDYTRARTQHGPYRYAGRFTDMPAGLYKLLSPGGLDQYDTDNLHESFATGDNYIDQDIWGVSGVGEWSIGDNTTLTSTTSYRSSDLVNSGDLDGTPFHFLEEKDDIHQHQFTQEFKASGTAFDDRLHYTTGLFYLREKASHLIDVGIMSDLPIFPFRGFNDRYVATYQTQSSYAAYGQADYFLTEKLSVTGGLRFTYEKKKANISTLRDVAGIYELPPADHSADWSAWTPRLGVNYKWDDSLMTYASVAKGFKSGGFNGRAAAPGTEGPFNPEYVWTYEAGVKSEFMDRRMRLNLAAFLNDYKDMQFAVSSLAADGVTLLLGQENAAGAKIKGIEAELSAAPFRGFELTATLGYLDAYFTEVSPAATEITKDSKLMGTPKWTLSLAARYDFQVEGAGDFTLAADYSYRSKIYFNPLNTPGITAALPLVNLQGTFKPAGTNVTVAVGATNLFDKQYYASGLGPAGLGIIRGVVGRPREWFARLSYDF